MDKDIQTWLIIVQWMDVNLIIRQLEKATMLLCLTLFLSGWGLYDPTVRMLKMQNHLCVAFYLLYSLIFSLFSDE